MSERWKQIADQPYEVSDLGRVRAIAREVSFTTRSGGRAVRKKKERLLKPWPTTGGYVQVYLMNREVRQVHTLVLEAFVGPRPEGHEAAHNDNVRSNNKLSNLSWKTRVANQADRHVFDTRYFKLKQAGVEAVYTMRAAGKTQAEIAKAVGVTQPHVSRVLRHWHNSGG